MFIQSVYNFLYQFRHSTANTTGQSTDSKKTIRAFDAIDIIYDRKMVTLEWVASPVNDMYADGILCSILQAESMDPPSYVPTLSSKEDKMHFKECLIEMLQVTNLRDFILISKFISCAKVCKTLICDHCYLH